MIKVKVDRIHPTQFVVGQKEVEFLYDKVDEILESEKSERKAGLKEQAGKVVIGPGGELYLTEGHHHGKALSDRRAKWMFVTVEQDWSNLSEKEFWKRMSGVTLGRKRTHFRI